MKRRKSPEIINLPAGNLDEIKTRFEAGSSLEEWHRAFSQFGYITPLILDEINQNNGAGADGGPPVQQQQG